MENVLVSLAFLACPLGMGVMMWFMARGMRKDTPSDPMHVGTSVEQLREEHLRLGAEIDRIDARDAGAVAGRS